MIEILCGCEGWPDDKVFTFLYPPAMGGIVSIDWNEDAYRGRYRVVSVVHLVWDDQNRFDEASVIMDIERVAPDES